MSEEENVVTFRPPLRAVDGPMPSLVEDEIKALVSNLTTFCERLEEGMNHVSKVLVAMDSRLRKLELAHNKAEREKTPKNVIYNGHGERVR